MVEQQTLKITNVLSDPTRFSIYQYVSRQREDVTVQAIAEQFNIHSNVARLHLTKLEDVNMLESETKKNGKGGRPSRFYRISDEVINLQFPYRDYQKLAGMAVEALVSLGDEGQAALTALGHKYGKEAAKEFLARTSQKLEELTVEEKVSCIEKIAINQGLNPDIEFDEKRQTIDFKIYNCTFKELVKEYTGALCNMHNQMLKGIFEYFFGDVNLKENHLMTDPEQRACSYSTVLLPK
ncbi:helix-turn-helix transcriptional regulator [Desertibacillus haloalkaliphilus]|uniref:helix-turn-helix transcriptional regulator n=1 Tax=Desertibacillus haloalkaliphilus TaxID=1328930 RepID=UPI001C27E630|nr:helix-turn-helix domain-containing protein [Desertibacillus haloalkaliphilus]MBU8908986.1 helix-turn-helix domain-containing protein [Desertibacillus haloalkaliphilus]